MDWLRSIAERTTRRGRAPRPSAEPPLVGFVVHGGGGRHPASAHVRVTGQLSALVAAGAARVVQLDPVRYGSGDEPLRPSVVLVQRDALPAAQVDRFLLRVRRDGARLVADVDDDFFSLEARARLQRAEYDPGRLGAVDRVVRAADLVLVSTEPLRRVLAGVGVGSTVVPNAVQPALWDAGPTTAPTVAPTDVRRVLYMGSTTHRHDLDLLRPVFDGFVDGAGVPVRLEVLGVADDTEPWFDRIALPADAEHYPDFAAFVRSRARRWSAGVAPLAAGRFNDAKSDVKFLEYALLGLPFVGSDRPPYRGAVDHGGLVVPDRPDAWRGALLRAFADGPTMVDRARRHVLEERTIERDPRWRRAVGL